MKILDKLFEIPNISTQALAMNRQALQGFIKNEVQEMVRQARISSALREYVLKFHNAAHEIVEEYKYNLFMTACLLLVLEIRINESKITPDWFHEISDKALVIDTIKYIHQNLQAVKSELSIHRLKLWLVWRR